MNKCSLKSIFAAVAATALATPSALVAAPFSVVSTDCSIFWLNRLHPVALFNITPGAEAAFDRNLPVEMFREAALKAKTTCDREWSSKHKNAGFGYTIREVSVKSEDGRVKAWYDVTTDTLNRDMSRNEIFRVAQERRETEERYQRNRAVDEDNHRRALEAQADYAKRQAEEIAARTKIETAQIAAASIRDKEMRQAQRDAEEARVRIQAEARLNEAQRRKAFFGSLAIQLQRIGTPVLPESLTTINDVRTNPFRFTGKRLAVVQVRFDRMLREDLAQFGNDLAKVLIRSPDVEKFSSSGTIYMLAFRVVDREDAERSFGSVPEIILSLAKGDTVIGDYIGAYECPNGDCGHLFDPPTATQ